MTVLVVIIRAVFYVLDFEAILFNTAFMLQYKM